MGGCVDSRENYGNGIVGIDTTGDAKDADIRSDTVPTTELYSLRFEDRTSANLQG